MIKAFMIRGQKASKISLVYFKALGFYTIFRKKNNQSILTEKNHVQKKLVPYPIAPRGALWSETLFFKTHTKNHVQKKLVPDPIAPRGALWSETYFF